jgi:hypothetical protein
MDDARAASCPICGSHVIPITYGFPTPETFKKAERGEVEIGGCAIEGDEDDHVCTGPGRHRLRLGVGLTED